MTFFIIVTQTFLYWSFDSKYVEYDNCLWFTLSPLFGLWCHDVASHSRASISEPSQCIFRIFKGVTYPAMHGVWRHWAPPLERSKLATTTFTGSYVGVMVGLPVSASLVSYIHWSAPFYVFGIIHLINSNQTNFRCFRNYLGHCLGPLDCQNTLGASLYFG